MPMKELDKKDRKFFENEEGKLQYNKICLACAEDCKQSYRVEVLRCKNRVKAHMPLEYKRKIENVSSVNEVCKKLKISKPNFIKACDGKIDFKSEWYVKLEKELYGKTLY